MIPSEVTVIIDSRERTPLLFPGWIDWWVDRTSEVRPIEVKTKRMVMPAGDYTLEGHDDVCIIETKRSMRELHSNVCTKEWTRVARALSRLVDSCKYPYLVLELTPSEMFRESQHVPNPRQVFSLWMQIAARLDLRVMFVGGATNPGPRRKLGEQLLRLMLAHLISPPRMVEPWSPDYREKMWKRAPTWAAYPEKKNDN